MVRRACEETIRQIVENDGFEGSVVVEKVKAAIPITRGFDAETNEYVDMMQAGVIDPTKGERVALGNSAGIAALLVCTGVLISAYPVVEDGAPLWVGGGEVWACA